MPSDFAKNSSETDDEIQTGPPPSQSRGGCGWFPVLVVSIIGLICLPMLLPLAPLIGYPVLLLTGLGLIVRWFMGHRTSLREHLTYWLIALGLVMILHGVVICFDTALAGAPPTAEEKRFGTRLAYLGGGIAGFTAVGAYVLGLKERRT